MGDGIIVSHNEHGDVVIQFDDASITISGDRALEIASLLQRSARLGDLARNLQTALEDL